VLVENKPGAGAQIASSMVAKAPADGYTLLLATTTHALNPALTAKLPHHSVHDFAPVSMLATLPMIVPVSPTVPASTVQELIALAKQNPGRCITPPSTMSSSAERWTTTSNKDTA